MCVCVSVRVSVYVHDSSMDEKCGKAWQELEVFTEHIPCAERLQDTVQLQST